MTKKLFVVFAFTFAGVAYAATSADQLAKWLPVGHETAMPQAIPYVAAAEVDAWLERFGAMNDDLKIQTLASLKVRGDKKYLPLATAAIEGTSPAVQRAGLLSLQTLGGADEVPLIVGQRFGDNAAIASFVLRTVVADGFDAALIAAMQKETDIARFTALAEDIGQRYDPAALPVIVARAKQNAAASGTPLLRAAEPLATKDDLRDFVEVAIAVADRGQHDEAERVVARLCGGNPEPLVAIVTDENAAGVLPILGRVGGAAALEAVRAAQSKPTQQAAAFRAICNWSDATVFEDLVKFASDPQTPEPDKIAALRGAIRVIALADDQIGIKITNAARLEHLASLMKMATRNQERQLVLDRVAVIRDVLSIQFAAAYLDDAELQQRACRTIADVAHHNNVRLENKEIVGPILDRVLSLVTDADLKERVRKYRASM
ncbi:MAG: hypothetical protein ACRC46_02845 [Thermoguttaceae bacterium]